MTELALAVSSADQTSSKLWLFWETKQDGTAARNQSRERDELCLAVSFHRCDVKVIMGSALIAGSVVAGYVRTVVATTVLHLPRSVAACDGMEAFAPSGNEPVFTPRLERDPRHERRGYAS